MHRVIGQESVVIDVRREGLLDVLNPFKWSDAFNRGTPRKRVWQTIVVDHCGYEDGAAIAE